MAASYLNILSRSLACWRWHYSRARVSCRAIWASSLIASSLVAASTLTPSARWAMLLDIWVEKSIIPWITVAEVVLKRHLRDVWLWHELRTL